MVGAFGFEPQLAWDVVLCFWETFYSHSVSLHLGIEMVIGKLNTDMKYV